jgi:Domain of unknown function (DUF4833)
LNTLRKQVKVSWFLSAAAFLTGSLQAGTPDHEALFHIERNINANIVQYDAQVGENGLLDEKHPIMVYWVRLAEEGQVKQLSWIEKKFAYGVKTKLNKAKTSATLDFALDLGKTLRVERFDNDYRAVTDIDGVPCFLDKMFVHITENGLSIKLDYVEMFGHAVDGQKAQYERYTP